MIFLHVMAFFLTMKVLERRNLRYKKNNKRSFKNKLWLEECIYMGNIDAKRDWGHAKDYVCHAMAYASTRRT